MRARVAGVVLALSMLAAPTAAPLTAQDVLSCGGDGFEWGFGPTIVPTDEFAKRFGAQANAGLCFEGHLAQKAGLWSWVLASGGRYLAVDQSVRIPDATEVQAAALLSWSLPGGDFELNPGVLEIGATAGYEASADRREQHLAAGWELRYANNSARRIGNFIPSIVVRWDWVEPTASEARDTTAAVTEAGDQHWRWSVRGYLNLRPAFFSTRLREWSLVVDASLFRADGLEQVLADAGWDSGEYIAVTLRYARQMPPRVGPISITSMYAGYAGGQLPTDFRGRDALTGGVTFTIGR